MNCDSHRPRNLLCEHHPMWEDFCYELFERTEEGERCDGLLTARLIARSWGFDGLRTEAHCCCQILHEFAETLP